MIGILEKPTASIQLKVSLVFANLEFTDGPDNIRAVTGQWKAGGSTCYQHIGG